MKPALFDYFRPQNLPEALSLLDEFGTDAKILAGGQSLIPLMNMRLAQPRIIIDINGIAEIGQIREKAEALEVGALVRQRALARYVHTDGMWELLRLGMAHIGHPQTRNQGTVGGSIAHADPSAELPLLFLTMDGEAEIASLRGNRKVPAEQFFQFVFSTVIQPHELLRAVHWKRPASKTAGFGFYEFSRRAGDFAMAAAAAIVEIDAQRRFTSIRLGLGGVGPTPVLVQGGDMLYGRTWSDNLIGSWLEDVTKGLDPPQDLAANPDFRRRLAGAAAHKSLFSAYQSANGKWEGRTHE
ncbi:MAG: FAD binding domain-containing protein [Firmicutes bacterium]|jgi:CO/xanthine dehydrogenase FAD-binding subunit|uniref:FAD-binding PCMH-type domain-containing protein n=1 Tax=Sulfobacillus benefaciens TaxID=453960 RepID=A0A2T2WS52_9FIRM|nr:FAD binding domain-containing protein [Bacillota bacterium]PSR25067.1 MAG: hypothetical protein C7B43_17695 [Sulfobacillus benefaciens]